MGENVTPPYHLERTMSNIIAVALTAGLCVGNIPEKIETHLIDDMRYCVFKDSASYQKCIQSNAALFWTMVIRYKPCFEEVVDAGVMSYGDGSFSEFTLKVRFRGMFHSYKITQLKQIDDKNAKAIQDFIQNERHQ